ncbi:MAG: biotin--[acetyl-CoA-carboxylase] ligase [Dehalococcoidia bacterium]
MKGRILQILREERGHVPGEALSRKLDVSRTCISRHIGSLRRHGYVIDSSGRGYRLASSPDLLLPSEFPFHEHRIHYFPEIGSTMDPARNLAREGVDDGTIIIAEAQTRGRGRLNREWVSPRGGIYLTMILRPGIAPPHAPLANLMASVAVATGIRELYGLKAAVKWPNDVLINGKKVCGILAEMESGEDTVKFINIGIGINANTDVPEFAHTATSLSEAMGTNISRQEFLRALLLEIDRRADSLTDMSMLQEWKDLSATLNRDVRIATADGEVAGLAVDVDRTGALILRQEDGSLRKIVAGDCSQ